MDHIGGAGKTDIYLAQEIWEGMHPDTCRLEVLLPGYGQFGLRFEQPIDGSGYGVTAARAAVVMAE